MQLIGKSQELQICQIILMSLVQRRRKKKHDDATYDHFIKTQE